MPIDLPDLPVGLDNANTGRIKWNAAITDIVNYINSEVDTSGLAKLAGGNTFTGNQIVNGQLTVDTNLRLRQLSGTDAIVHLASGTGYMNLAGGSGSAASSGGNILLYGQSHATTPNEVVVRNGTSIVARFSANRVAAFGTVDIASDYLNRASLNIQRDGSTDAAGGISADSTNLIVHGTSGGNMVFRPQGRTTTTNQMTLTPAGLLSVQQVNVANGLQVSGALELNGQTVLEPFYINPREDGDFYITFSKPMTLDIAGAVTDGDGAVEYARKPVGGSFNTITASTAFAVGDTLRVTVSGLGDYLTITIPRTL